MRRGYECVDSRCRVSDRRDGRHAREGRSKALSMAGASRHADEATPPHAAARTTDPRNRAATTIRAVARAAAPRHGRFQTHQRFDRAAVRDRLLAEASSRIVTHVAESHTVARL